MKNFEKPLIYADYNSTYPVSAAHVDAVATLLKTSDGNPSNIHGVGRRAKLVVEEARSRIATLIGGQREEVFFTSGATEANNWVVQALVASPWQQAAGQAAHVVISAGEHASVVEPLVQLEAAGRCQLTTLPLDAQGQINSAELLAALRPSTVLVALIYANNETGAVLDLPTLAGQIKATAPRCHLHTDAVQALGKLDTRWLGRSAIDSVALSAHKVGGFKGIGCLWLRAGTGLAPLLVGGGQERQRRSGTENLPGILSFSLRAKELAEKPDWLATAAACGDALRAGLAQIKGAQVHGVPGLRHTVNFHIDGLAGDALLLQLDMAGVCASSGSACASGVGTPSRVLLGMGYPAWVARNSIRLSFGAGSSAEDVEAILAVIRQCRP